MSDRTDRPAPEDLPALAPSRRDGPGQLGGPPAAPPRPVTANERSIVPRRQARKAYGDALVALGARPEVVALDGEVGNSTYAGQFAAYPDRFFEMFIAEQQLIAAAVGLAVRRYVPFASTFAAFLSRAYDFLRMAGISGANIKLCGSHAGVEIGPDGPSQMALEDLAALRAIHGFHRALPGRRHRCRRPDRADGRHARDRLPAHHAGRLARPVPGR